MVFRNGVKNIQVAAYNGARTVSSKDNFLTPLPPHTHCVLKCGFMRAFPGNQDATLK